MNVKTSGRPDLVRRVENGETIRADNHPTPRREAAGRSRRRRTHNASRQQAHRARGQKQGDRVLISKYGGTDVKIGGTEYVILRERRDPRRPRQQSRPHSAVTRRSARRTNPQRTGRPHWQRSSCSSSGRRAQEILRGVRTLAKAVRSRSDLATTNVVLDEVGLATVTKDGVSVAKIDAREPYREHGRADGARSRVRRRTSPVTARRRRLTVAPPEIVFKGKVSRAMHGRLLADEHQSATHRQRPSRRSWTKLKKISQAGGTTRGQAGRPPVSRELGHWSSLSKVIAEAIAEGQQRTARSRSRSALGQRPRWTVVEGVPQTRQSFISLSS